jgi:hypothetical protein
VEICFNGTFRKNKKPVVETTGACDQKDHMRKSISLLHAVEKG